MTDRPDDRPTDASRDPSAGATDDAPIGRALNVILSAAITVAFLGYFIGVDTVAPEPNEVEEAAVTRDTTVIPALAYADLRERPLGPNTEFRSRFVATPNTPVPVDAEITITEADKTKALAERASLRAYNGAPPTIPHAVDAMSVGACLTCHEHGLEVGGLVARPMPHASYASCTQCHVPELRELGAPRLSNQNAFDGLPAPTQGARAYPGAPPVVPHSTHMRTNCLACHGGMGRLGIQSTHPWRHSCLQCHAPSAELDQRELGGGPSFLDPIGGERSR